MNFNQFDLWDVLADIVPGAVGIILFASILPKGYILSKLNTLPVTGLPGLFTFVIVSYVIGWVIQATALKIDGVFTRDYDPWETQIKKVKKAQEDDKWNFARRYYEECQLFFNTSNYDDYSAIENEISSSDLRSITYNYLNNNNIGRSYRFHILFILSRSLYVIFAISLITHLSILFLNSNGIYYTALSFTEGVVLVISLMWGSFIMWKTRLYMERSMIKSLMGDFYMSLSN
ncbi:hypothetical protein [Halohasta litorea]|uniref:Uncharacterized protein n=1 Tax=Halohasta litorea TaxID=869891 RepID=A0ABD6D4L8_9EURY|nr:hypothetical protein [Halohasta litorea]